MSANNMESDEDFIAGSQAASIYDGGTSLNDETTPDVSSQLAFDILEELFDAEKITGVRMADLKEKYLTLLNMLVKKRKSENRLLQNAKCYTAEIEKQNLELDKADDFPENINTEVGTIRHDLLKCYNEIEQLEGREYDNQYRIKSLEEEVSELQEAYEKLPTKEQIETKKRDIFLQCDQTKKEITQRTTELRTLKEDYEAKRRQSMLEDKELDRKLEEQDILEHDLSQLHAIPIHIAKEIERINKHIMETEKLCDGKNETIKEIEEEIKAVEEQRHKTEEKRREVDGKLLQQKVILGGRERDYEIVLKNYEFEKEREAALLGDRASLNLYMRHSHLEKKSVHEIMTRKQREKDRALRQLKKLELQWHISNDALTHQKNIFEKFKEQAVSLPQDDSLYEKRRQLQQEVDDLKRKLVQQNNFTSTERVKVEDSILEEEKLIKEQEHYRIIVNELTRHALFKVDEREQKSRDYMKAELQYYRTLQELKNTELTISDHRKKVAEVLMRLHEFAKLYDAIKNERNKCVNQIQASKQKSAEMKEKIKILANEIEILRTTVSNIEKNLQKDRLKGMNVFVLRDSLRSERVKALATAAELNEERDQLKMNIDKLDAMNNHAEHSMILLRKRYENAVTLRNERGIQLVEREEEVCIFCERFNIQESMIRNGDVAIQEMEEEIRFLTMRKTEEERKIKLGRKNKPNVKQLNDQVVNLQIELSQYQDTMKTLEHQLETPDRYDRVVLLPGKDPSPKELQDLIEKLEIRLSKKEEDIMERELIFHQTTRLTEQLHKKIDTGKSSTLTLAKKCNIMQSRLKDVSKKMMSLISELAMKQAKALKLQQQTRSMRMKMQQCYSKMEQGEPPSDDIAIEWEKMVRKDEKKRLVEVQKFLEEQEEMQFKLPDGSTTTADPRPNAYIPDDENELPIPKPYGSMAPFKPSEPGSSMRHYRKPSPATLDL